MRSTLALKLTVTEEWRRARFRGMVAIVTQRRTLMRPKLDQGNKRSVVWFRSYVQQQGHDVNRLWRNIADICVKTVMIVKPKIAKQYVSTVFLQPRQARMSGARSRRWPLRETGVHV